MNTVSNKIILTIFSLILSFSVQASENSIPASNWLCALNFNGTSQSVQIIIGHSEFKGAGTISCVSSNGEAKRYPILVSMKTKPIAAKIGLGKMELFGEALQISLLASTPENLFGKYTVLEGRASIIGGAGVIVATHVSNPDLSLSITLQLAEGLGLDVGFRKMKIELDTRQYFNQ